MSLIGEVMKPFRRKRLTKQDELRRQNAVALGWTITGSPDQLVGQRPGTSEFSSYAEPLPQIARKAKR